MARCSIYYNGVWWQITIYLCLHLIKVFLASSEPNSVIYHLESPSEASGNDARKEFSVWPHEGECRPCRRRISGLYRIWRKAWDKKSNQTILIKLVLCVLYYLVCFCLEGLLPRKELLLVEKSLHFALVPFPNARLKLGTTLIFIFEVMVAMWGHFLFPSLRTEKSHLYDLLFGDLETVGIFTLEKGWEISF